MKTPNPRSNEWYIERDHKKFTQATPEQKFRMVHGLSLGQFRRKFPKIRWGRKFLRDYLGVGGNPTI